MSTNVKPLTGRHRAAVDTRSTYPPAALRALLGIVAVLLLLAALIAWWLS